MTMLIAYEDALALGGDAEIAQLVADFQQALVEHASTVGVPAPTAHPIIEAIVRQHGGAFEIGEAPQEAPPMPNAVAPITRRQLILALVAAELITAEEALAAARTGEVPATVQATFDSLPPADKLAAEVTWATMSIAERSHPLVTLLAAANNMSEADVDDFFELAAGL